MLVSVEGNDKFDKSTRAVDGSDEEFRTIEASLDQVLHRTTANAPPRNSATNTRTEGIRSMTCNGAKVRSEEHV